MTDWSRLPRRPAAGLPAVDTSAALAAFRAAAREHILAAAEAEQVDPRAVKSSREGARAPLDAARGAGRGAEARVKVWAALQPWIERSWDDLADMFAATARARVVYARNEVEVWARVLDGDDWMMIPELELDGFLCTMLDALRARGLKGEIWQGGDRDKQGLVVTVAADAPEPLKRAAREVAPLALKDPEYVLVSDEADALAARAVAFINGGDELAAAVQAEVARAPLDAARGKVRLAVPGTAGSPRAMALAAARVRVHADGLDCFSDRSGLGVCFRFGDSPA